MTGRGSGTPSSSVANRRVSSQVRSRGGPSAATNPRETAGSGSHRGPLEVGLGGVNWGGVGRGVNIVAVSTSVTSAVQQPEAVIVIRNLVSIK